MGFVHDRDTSRWRKNRRLPAPKCASSLNRVGPHLWVRHLCPPYNFPLLGRPWVPVLGRGKQAVMKAVVFKKYGSPDVLQLQEVEKPVPKDGQVLVKIQAASVNALDWHLLRADPFPVRLAFGLLKPKNNILGADIAGRVEAVGKNAGQFQPGDEVFGDIFPSGLGGFAEYACAAGETLVKKPAAISFEEAAALPVAGLTALQALRDDGHIQPGQKVLVNGAAGGVGTF